MSPYIVARSEQGLSPVTAYTLLLSASTGEPVLLVDSLALTTARTAATTALAVDHLAAPGANTLAVIGAGTVAIEHIRHVSAGRTWNDIAVFSPSLADDASEAGAARRDAVAAVAPHARVADSAADAVAGADVVMLCTSSGSPVVDMADVSDGALVTSISTNAANAHEVDPSALLTVDVYCDYRATSPITAGEMVLAADLGWNADDIEADLPELVSGYEPDTSRTRFFRSTGLGIEDLAIASLSSLMGADLYLDETPRPIGDQSPLIGFVEQLRDDGHTPYLIPGGASEHPLGSFGYMGCAAEIVRQQTASGVDFDHIVHCTGSSSTQAGLLAGFAHMGRPMSVIGVADDHETDIKRARVLELANNALTELGSDARVDAMDVEIIAADPSEYGEAEPETFELIRRLARTEGIVADPVYEGKALRGLARLVGDGRFAPGARVLLMHLGGTPAVHAYANQFGAPTFVQPAH